MSVVDDLDFELAATIAELDDQADDPEPRYPLRPLAAWLGISLGQRGGHQPGQPESGLRLLASRIGVSYSTAQRYQRHGLTWAQADAASASARLLPRAVWPDWLRNAPGEEDLADRPCRCRPCQRAPLAGWCDRCGGRLDPHQIEHRPPDPQPRRRPTASPTIGVSRYRRHGR